LLFGANAGAAAHLIADWLLPLALLTLAVGMIGVVGSARLRLQIAYLVVASIGTLLIAIGLGTAPGIGAGLYYLPHSTFAAAALLLLADLIAGQRGKLTDRLEPGPLLGRHWPLAVLFFLGAILSAGLPPLSGFIGKFLILRAALDHPLAAWVVGVVLTGGLLAVMALARSGSLLFYAVTATHTDSPAPAPPDWQALAVVAALLGLCAGMTIWAGPLSDYTAAMAAQLLHPAGYVQAVLGAGSSQ
jgi:multicomponent K+:H+ antiporter subunit D